MIDAMKQKMLDPEVTNALQATLGVSMTGTGAANLIGWIDIASSFLSFIIAIVGLVLTVYTIINASHKMQQNRIKTKMDLLTYEKARKDFESISN